MRATAVLAIVSLLALAGCTQTNSASTSGFQGAEKAVAQTVADLSDAGQKREAAEICGSVIADSLREELAAGASSCNTEMQKAIEDADDFELEVQDVRIQGDRATAQVRATARGGDRTREFQFVREDGDWRISSFGAAGS